MIRNAHLTVPARRDLIDHFVYLGENDLKVAERFLDAARVAMEQLVDMPELGALRQFKDPRLKDTRLWPIPGFRNYIIFYQHDSDKIRVLRVLHAAQDYHRVFRPE